CPGWTAPLPQESSLTWSACRGWRCTTAQPRRPPRRGWARAAAWRTCSCSPWAPGSLVRTWWLVRCAPGPTAQQGRSATWGSAGHSWAADGRRSAAWSRPLTAPLGTWSPPPRPGTPLRWSCSNVPFAASRARSCPCPLCWIPACWYSAAASPARRGGRCGPRWNVPGSRPRSTSCRRAGWPSWACGPVRTARSWPRRSRSRPPENLAPVAADRLAKVWPMTTPPCAELHLHLEGTFEPELVFTLAERNQIPLDYPDPDALHAAKEFTDLQSFLDLYYACMQVLRTEEDCADLTRGYLARAREAGVRHAEIMVDPQAHVARGVPLQVVVD